jgi:hypothetical protein
MIKTLVVWDDGTDPKFAMLDGDYRRFHNKFIASSIIESQLEQEMLNYFYRGENGEELKIELFQAGPFQIPETKDTVYVVNCGCSL